jgi:uncharacterized membrane protein YphA (DoxX/SURF4 family)
MRTNRWESLLLLTCRLIAGGAFLVAPVMKLQNPQSFMLSIKSFGLVPEAIIPFLAYFVPWAELACGALLIYGLWTRPAAIVATGLYAAFTAALMYVILSGMKVDCGCFAGLFGSGEVGWNSIARNSVFLVASILPLVRGGGALSVDELFAGSPPEGSRARADVAASPALSSQAT